MNRIEAFIIVAMLGVAGAHTAGAITAIITGIIAGSSFIGLRFLINCGWNDPTW